MRILLDENFPLALLWKLQEEGHQVDHIILLGLRGAPDRAITNRLNSEDLLFLTHDQVSGTVSHSLACHNFACNPKSADNCTD